MSMSTRVYGLVEPTSEYRAKCAAWRACKAAGVAIPDELLRYFDYQEPDEAGMRRVLPQSAVSPISRDMVTGIAVRVRELPPEITTVVFENNW